MTALASLTADPSPTTSNLVYTVRSNTSYKLSVSSLFAINTSFDHLTIQPASSSQVPLTVNGAVSQTADLIQFQNSSGTVLTSFGNTGLINKYNSITTAGFGVPTVVATASVTAQTTFSNSIMTYTPGADGVFRVSFAYYITSFTSGTSNVRLQFTDTGGTSRIVYLCASTATPSNVFGMSATGAYVGYAVSIKAKASNSINLGVANGTTQTYDFYSMLEQIA